MRDLLIVLGAVVLVILSSAWWPAIGQRCADTWTLYTWHRQLARDRRQWVMPPWTGPDSPQTPVPADDPDDNDDPAELCAGCQDPDGLMHCDGRDRYCDCTCGREDWLSEDDGWADELHAINLATHRDRPIRELTHYEIEAVIRDLGVPEWVPAGLRERVAA